MKSLKTWLILLSSLLFSQISGENPAYYIHKSFDSNGLLKSHTLYGNLSGEESLTLSLDEKGAWVDNGIERYAVSYEYTDDTPPRIQKITEDNGKEIVFHYGPDNDKLIAQFLQEKGEIIIRTFYEYNREGRISLTTVDDGSGLEYDDLQGVTERKLMRCDPSGGEVKLSTYYFDLQSGEEQLLNSEIMNFTNAGELQHRFSFDSQGSYCYGSSTDYVNEGQSVSFHDTEGRTASYSFDEQGRIYHGIDEKARKRSSIDRYDNETVYQHDDQGRLSAEIYPTVLDKNGKAVKPTYSYAYDSDGRISSITDPERHTTSFVYNAKGKPVEIRYADGSIESYLYTLDGKLKSSKQRNGLETRFGYDIQKRPLWIERVDADSNLLWREQYTYNAFHRLSHTDKEGKITFYHYNGAGQLIGQDTKSPEGIQKQEYSYDTRGLPAGSKEWFGPQPNDYTLESVHRDSSGSIAATTISSAAGELLLKKKTEPSSSNATHLINQETTNSLGQLVRQTVSIDERDNETIVRYDALNRIDLIERKDEEGNALERTEIMYDLVGNKVKETRHLTASNGQAAISVRQWDYDSLSRPVSATEAAGSALERKTLYSYDLRGYLIQIIRPDNTVINFEYGAIGLPGHIHSSDGTIDYALSYDNLGNIVHVEDKVAQCASKRQFRSDKKIAEETLGNGLAIAVRYDLRGRKNELCLPDGSGISYRFDGVYLREAARICADGTKMYGHLFKEYDKEGRLLTSQLAGKGGFCKYDWSPQGHCLGTSTSHWIASSGLDGYDRNGNLIQLLHSDAMGSIDIHYTYGRQGELNEEYPREHTYDYDAYENRIVKDGICYVYDELDQLLQAGNTTYRYDRNGNRIEKNNNGAITTYSYDAYDRLTGVSKEGVYRVEYTYDFFHRRLSEKKYRWTGEDCSEAATLLFLYDGDNEIGAYDPEKGMRQFRLLGGGQGAEIGSAVAMEIDGASYAPIHDWQGSVAALIDTTTGKLAEGYRYSSFGEEQIFTSKKQWVHKSAIGNPWRYSSKRIDNDTGLIYYGRRYYDPQIGRWLTLDPLGDKDGRNRYAFVHNNPVNYRDCYGLYSISSAWNSFIDHSTDIWLNMHSRYLDVSHSITHTFHLFGLDASELEKFGEYLMGEQNFFMTGFQECETIAGSCGKEEVSDKVRITYINGIMTSIDDLVSQAGDISSTHGNTLVHYIYSPTKGWTWDLIQGAFVKVAAMLTPQAYTLAAKWQALIQEMGGPQNGGKIIHYAHSVGGSNSYRALQLLTVEERKMIEMRTFGSSTLVGTDEINTVNYVSYRDGVPYLDPLTYLSALWHKHPHIIFLGSPLDGFPIIDHLFTNNSYRPVWEKLGEEFVDEYGQID